MIARRVLALATLALVACTAPRGSDFARKQMPVIQSQTKLLQRKIKDIAGREEARAHYRGEGLRVCEEFEVGTRWKEDCNTCICEEGSVRPCTKALCHPHRELRLTPTPKPGVGP